MNQKTILKNDNKEKIDLIYFNYETFCVYQ